jgi:hypothetical protein
VLARTMDSLGSWHPWLLIPATAVFALMAFLTRASRGRLGAACITVALFAAGNIAWDLVGQPMGWWYYPAFVARGYAPLWLYFAGGAVFGGGFGLIGWRVVRGFGTPGLLMFVGFVTALGVLRDYRMSQRFPDDIVFGGGVMPWIADAAGWASLALLVQSAHWFALGATRDEPLRH